MSGVLVDKAVVSEYTPTHREGMSLLELRDACARFGLQTEVRFVAPEDIGANAPLPLLARISATSNTINNAHYVVVFAMDHETLSVVDGTTGAIETYRRELLPNVWTGYVLVPVKRTGDATFSLLTSAWLVVLTVMALIRFVPALRKSTKGEG
jgi:ABC-type bacteriocin/lantibiotic exporter with double-glycine peptidase domain